MNMQRKNEKGKTFENEVADIYRMLGYEVVQNVYICGKKVDIYATRSIPLTENKARIIIECKNWKNKAVGNKLILQFKGLIDIAREADKADYAVFVTSGNYSDYAFDIAEKAKLKLLTYNQLLSKLVDFTQNLKLYIDDFERGPLFKNYISLNFCKLEDEANVERIKVEKYIEEWLKSKSSNYIAILADYGMGKTSLCKYFTYNQAKKYLNDPENERIPILINLKEFYRRFEIEAMVTNFLVNRCGISTNYMIFRKLLQLGKAVVILDGFDEMAQQVDREVRKKNFEALAELALPNNKIIITGRPNYFVNKEEMEEILNRKKEDDIYKQIARELKNKPMYEIIYLRLFNEKQIDQFLEKQSLCISNTNNSDLIEIKETIDKIYNLTELVKRPFLLDMVIKSISKIKGKVKKINAGKLYDIFTSAWLDREYEKGEFRNLIKRDDKKFFIQELAWQMAVADKLQIHYSNLSDKIKRHFKLERMEDIDYFSSDIQLCSYLNRDDDGNYKFIHKSFQEFFVAMKLLDDIKKGDISSFSEMSLSPEISDFFADLLDENTLGRIFHLLKSKDNIFFSKVITKKTLLHTLASKKLETSFHSCKS